ncbi:MAG: hypothetical protein KAW12_16420 [Candidatus Aminicenantes bacterium]|nr:hypothetical protein [Candidatus Aminicenantes bacterium]
MLNIQNDPEVLKNKIISGLNNLDAEELKQLYRMIAKIAARKAAGFADKDWAVKGLSRDLINEEIGNYRQAGGK